MRREPPLDVLVERAPGVERRVRGEHDVGRRGGEVAPVGRVARLEQDGVALRPARRLEQPDDVRVRPVVRDRPHRAGPQELARDPVGQHRVVVPRVPQGARDLDDLGRPRVPLGVGQVPAAAEVGAREGVGARHEVPRRAALGEQVEGRELLRELPRLVERRVDRAREAEPLRDGRERGEDGQRVGAADDVEVVDAALVLAQAQALGEEEEVELRVLGAAREVLERREVDLAARAGVAPHGGVVDAREVGAEVDLLAGSGAHVGSVRAQAIAA
ncbi:Uncharacterised protein [Mycobacteroides abscessus]|nr:Uncharacterised protein [Mycobacteroides abscessus]